MPMKHADNSSRSNGFLYWIILLYVSMFLLIAPYKQGVFNSGAWNFEGPVYMSALWGALGILFISIANVRKGTESNMLLLQLAIWLVPLAYYISSIGPASNHLSEISVYISILWAVFFTMGLYVGQKYKFRKYLITIICILIYFIVIYGIINWFGLAHYKNAVLNGRLAGVFQYPNTYAALLVGIYFASLSIANKNKYDSNRIHYCFCFMLVPIMMSLLLTLSRGGYILFFIVFIVYLFLLSFENQIKTIIATFITGVLSASWLQLLISINEIVLEKFNLLYSLGGVGIIIITSVINVILVNWCYKIILHRFRKISTPIYFMPLLILLLFLILIALLFIPFTLQLLPDALEERIVSFSTANESYKGRIEYFKDSFKIFMDYVWFGTGGGGWTSLYSQYQDIPYTANKAHSFYAEYIIEVGFVGILAIIILVICIFKSIDYSVLRNEIHESRIASIVLMSSLLIHSFIDFDMSFVYISTLVFLLLGLSIPVKATGNSTPGKYYKWSISFLSFIVFMIVIVQIIPKVQAHNYYSVAMNGLKNNNLLSEPINKSYQLDPGNPNYALSQVQLLIAQYNNSSNNQYIDQAIKVVEDIYNSEPFNKNILEIRYKLLLNKNENLDALYAAKELVEKYPWTFSHYEQVIQYGYEFGKEKYQKDHDEHNTYWRIALDTFSNLNNRIDIVNSENVRNKRGFRITPMIALQVGEIYYTQSEYENAKSILKTRLVNSPNDEIERLIAQYYLATLYKLGEQDKELSERLFEKFPEDKANWEDIL